MRKPLFFTFKFSSLTVALIIGLIGVLNFSIATSAPTKSVSEWLFGQSATRLSSGVVKGCADETRGDDVTIADCMARQGNQLLRNSTLRLGENLVETSGSTLFGENFKLKSKLSWGDGSEVQGELDAVIPVWSEAQTKSLFIQPGIAIWPGLGAQKQKRTDANLGLVYRSLNVGGDALFGGSIFYDRNLDQDNQRLGLGFDVQTQLGYASFNYYYPLSNDWRQGRSGFEERVRRGYDFRLEKLFYQGRIDVDLNLGAWRRNQPSKWTYTYGIDLGYKVTNYLSLTLGYEDFSGRPLSGLPSSQRWQLGLKLDLMKLYAPKPAQHAGNQSPLDLWRTVTREKRILYQERVAGTIIGFATSNYNVLGRGRARMMELTIKASEPLSKDVALSYSTRDGTATAGLDYEVIKNGSVTIKAGDTTSETIPIKIIANTVGEPAEQFSVDLSLSTATAGVRVNPATVTITIDAALAPRVVSIERLTPASSNGTTNSNTVSWLITFSKLVQNVDVSDFVLNAGGSSTGATASSAPLQSNGTVGQNIDVSNFALNAGGSSNGAMISSATPRNNDTKVVITGRSNNEGALSLSFHSLNDIADEDGNRLLNTIPTSGINENTFIIDSTGKPVITLNGLATVSLEVGDIYTEAGATASDNADGDISANIVISGSVDTSTVGIYTLSYKVSDSNSNAALTVTRTVTVVDTTLPVITLNGSANVSLEVGDTYTELNATASDNVDGDISANIQISGSVDTNTVGIYTLSYKVSDSNNNAALMVTRTVTVVDTTLPVITLNGSADVSLEVGDTYTELNATASDNVDGDISANIQISGSVDTSTVGIYTLSYKVSDSNSNAALTVTRTVTVVDTALPVITLNGLATVSLEVGDIYTEAGATASDNADGDISANIQISGSVDTNTVGIYTLSYKVSDSNNNAALTVTRTVTVVDTTLPVITLNGSADVSLEVGDTYTELNATASDNVDGDISANIQISGSVDTSTVGIYTLSYKVSDSNSNAALTVTRTVTVVDTTLPVITLNGLATVSLEVGGSYTELNATASDNVDGDISANIQISGSVDTSTVGIYTLSYKVSDSNSNAALTVTRTVTVVDTTLPVITLNGSANVSLEVGGSYTEAGATASDNVDGDISANIVIEGDTVDASTVGIYTLSYKVSDSNSNAALTVTRTVTVVDTTLPVITLNGSANVSLEVGGSYTEAGATASDNVDGDISANIVIEGDTVDANTVSIYNLSYNVVDNAGNAADEVIRTVIVTADATNPVITLNGPATVSLELGRSYSDEGATATDNIDGDITGAIATTNPVDTNIAATYTITYNVSDAALNAADEVTREVIVTADATNPVITLNGPATVSLELGRSYSDEGATATDNIDGDITGAITTTNQVDTNIAATYTITYKVMDAALNAAEPVTREVIVTADATNPVITLNGPATVSLELGRSYSDEGATATDNIDGDITGAIATTNPVDTNIAATYTITYNVSDAALNAADEVIRTVKVTADVTKPVITLLGEASVNLEVGYPYIEASATAQDNIDGEITNDIVINSTHVDANTIGTYSVTYNVVDDAGNAADEVIRTVIVTADVTKPVITLNGPATVSLELGRSYSDEGATATDNIDGDITGAIATTNPVDTNIAATYTITYNVSDAALNAADEVTREVIVTADATNPVITLNGPATVSLELGRSYSDEGATATDNIDGDITGAIATTNPVDTNIAATYTITYNVSDAALNAADEVTREVIVTADATNPVITLNGPATVNLELGRSYSDEGATATDNIDGPIDSSRIEIDSTNVDTNTVGTYTVTYNVIDAALNPAEPVTREVIVTADKTKPVITLNGPATVSLERGNTYTELGATAEDNIDGPIDSSRIEIDSTNVDTNTVGTYTVTYNVIDAALNPAEPVTREVIVTADKTKPVITLNGPATVSLERGNTYTELGATAEDNIDGPIDSSRIEIDSTNVDTNTVGTYTVTYNVIDAALNPAEPVTREVIVTADKTKPVITLNGPATVSLERGNTYTELGATAEDNIDGPIDSSRIEIDSTNVDTNTVGTYTVTYNVIDAALNPAEPVTREVIVTADKTKPVITLNGPATVSLERGNTYTELGATAEDNIDGPIDSSRIEIGSTNVDTNTVGTYTVTYNVIDAALNPAEPVTREVIVTADKTKPVITLNGPATVSLERGNTYTELGATAEDNIDGPIDSSRIEIDSTNVDTNTVGTYTVTYNVIDAALNAADEVTREVIVTADATNPVITLNGPATVSLELGRSYSDEGATATDNIDGDITGAIATSNPVDTNIAATYTITYNVSDAALNAADEVTREVIVTADVTKPVITLNGPATVSLELGRSYSDEGATATDNIDGDITGAITTTNPVDTNIAATYTITYNVIDAALNAADEVTREVIVTADATNPVISLNGPATVSLELGRSYSDEGATATDNIDGDITGAIATTNPVDTNIAATYTITYKVMDAALNAAEPVTRTVIVTADVTNPVITLNGPATVSLELGRSYSDEGATATDNIDGDITGAITTTNPVDTNIAATYTITYKVMDAALNAAEPVTRTVIVTADVTNPVITLNGPATVSLELGRSYSDEGATATDNIDGDITGAITTTNPVDTNIAATYTITYNVSDAALNAADEVTREVIVTADVTKPVITLNGPATVSLELGRSYSDEGATATDNIDGDITGAITTTNPVDTNIATTYTITYNVMDAALNAADEVIRTVKVTADATKPVITLLGEASVNLEVGYLYREDGATASDNIDGEITIDIVINSTHVDANTIGTYSVTYNVVDDAGNAADEVIRTVKVTGDVTKPVITLLGEASVNLEVGYLYSEDGATATDNIDGEITNDIVINSTSVDANTIGTYSVTYNVVDDAGNAADEVIRTVKVTADVTKPVITLLGEASVNLEVGYLYREDGATATDNIDGEITIDIVINSTHVDANTVGTYSVTYNVVDDAGNAADEVIRTVKVTADVTKPVITLLGEASVNLEVGYLYSEDGATATDNIDGEITTDIVINSTSVDANTIGTYSVTYNVVDDAGNAADEVIRTVKVTADVTKPVITLLGEASVNLEVGYLYSEDGATASDNIDGEITNDIVINSTHVDANTIGTYSVTYNVVDDAGNAADEVIRTVKVTGDVTKPVITLLGEASVNLEVGYLYSEDGATATDNIDGEITNDIVINSTHVDANTVGTYSVTYNVVDDAGNAADEVIRTVKVTADVTKPVITLLGEASVNLEVGYLYSEDGATASDNIDGEITNDIVINSTHVDANTIGTYSVTYNVVDDAGNAADEVIRTVKVTGDVTKPVITLLGEASVNLEVGYLYREDGATASDNIDGEITIDIVINSTHVDANTIGTYSVTYNVVDDAGNAADEVIRTVKVTADVTKPVITLNGPATVSLELGRSYSDEGATATDNIDGDITGAIATSNPVDTNIAATYTITYNVSDAALNAADEVTREVIVTADATNPVITLNGPATVSLELGRSYSDEGATATDNIDGDITGAIATTNPVDTNIAATYTITYNVSDAALNAADEVIRTVKVTGDVTKPVITLLGEASVNLEVGYLYSEDGATATDNIDGEITNDIVINSTSVDANTIGTYSVTYNVVDDAGNAADEVIRTVKVTADVTKPVITLLGEASVNLEVGYLYSEDGATASDNIDGEITNDIVINSTHVDANTIGTYSVTYNVVDDAGNAADEVIRTVKVTGDVTKPVITLLGEASVNLEVGYLYSEDGATATDNIDGEITNDIVINSTSVDANTIGTYSVTYNVVDDAGNAADEVIRTVKVTADVTKPVITLLGEASVNLEVGYLYSEDGATASDNIDGEITNDIVINSTSVDANTIGTYSVTYNVVDDAGNAADEVIRTVKVTADVTKPVITLNGPATVSLELGRSYTDEGATATDNIDGDITGAITTTNPVDTNIAATYTITYKVMDAALNAAEPVTRTVIVTADVTKPVITLNGPATVSLELGRSYSDEGATATDNIDGDITGAITTTNPVDTNIAATYTITYKVMDAALNAAEPVTRTVIVTADVTNPVITLNGPATVSLELGRSYSDEGATATDNIDGDITGAIATTNPVDTNIAATYTITYNVSDAALNAADEVTREVIVTADVTKPVITLNGPATVSLELGRSYSDEGATATDNIDGDITGAIATTNPVDTNIAATYTITYNVSDAALNAADEVTREVIVTADATNPVISLNGPATVSLELGRSYSDEGATATDNIDGDITGAIATTNPVDTNIAATYTITYNVSDAALNAADEVIRTVKVTGDVTKPVITLLGEASVNLEVGYLYSEDGATATDNIDGEITNDIVINSTSVDANTIGTYSVTYNVVDDAGNAADEVIRTVKVTADVTKPVITLLGEASVNLEVGYLYSEDGATASDNIDGEITNDIVINSTHVDANTIGTYSVTYNVVDDAGNAADEVIRTVKVTGDVTKPVITLLGEASVNLEVGYLYSEDGATATDNIDGEITNDIVINSTSVDANTIGTYSVTYNVVDDAGNAADEVIRTVKVTADVTKPVITLLGEASVNLEVGYLYSEDGATASDNIDGEITNDIVINSTSVDANTIGTYSVTYNVVDDAGNAADEVIRTVKVTADVTKPVITLNGPATVSLELGRSYTDEGATATDNIDGDITGAITTTNPVDTNIAATYTITYKVMDAALNAAEPVTRTVIVTADVTKPVISLNGPATVSLELGRTYTDEGATATDNIDGDITGAITTTNPVDTNIAATYTITYKVMDAALNAAEPVTRTVIVTADVTKPVISLNGPATVSLELGRSYTDEGATATDNIDGDITGAITTTNPVDTNIAATYTITYKVMDAALNAAEPVTRTVIVTADVTKPVITLNGPATVSLELGRSYSDEGATATDNIDGDITGAITTTNPVDTNIAATYTITYKVMDAALNAAEPVTRTVIVTADVTKPVITLNGPATVSLELGRSYSDEGATATDNIDGDITGAITTTNPVDTNIAATYTITYKVMDAALNAAEPVTRTVIVTADVTNPVITLNGPATVSLELGRSYSDEGATATDNIDGDITGAIATTNPVDTNIAATYTITYNVSDAALNAADEVTREVIVTADVTKPVITLNGPATVSLELGRSYSDEGATATDNIDGDITGAIATTNPVDTNIAATYTITYNVSDAALNAADEVIRTVKVTADVTKPVITLLGEASVNLEVGYLYREDGATATDNIDGEITNDIVINSTSVDANTVGTYSVTYNVVDDAGNAADEVIRTVKVTADVTKPVITLLGEASVNLEVGYLYSEDGATASDNIDGEITNDIVINSTSVDANTIGTYSVTYNVVDDAGNAADEVIRTVKVTADVTKPVITLLGEASVNLEVGYLYREDGATATDNIDGEITNDIVINSTHVDANTIGTYSVTYNVVDDAGNAADEVIRTVKVTADVTKPVITLLGEASVNLEVGYLYSEAGATASDNIDGEITIDIVINSTHVDANTVGTYSVTYNVVDDAGNAADEVIRTVKVTADVTKPVITLLGEASVNLEVGYLYSEDGATATDNIDGEITTDIVINSTHVDANTVGTYSVTYNVVDDAGNAADEVIRTVKVTGDVTKPVITLLGEASVNLEVGYLYSEDGATASDNIDGEITIDIVINSTHVDANTIGTYSVTYNVVDDAGNAADEVIRTVKVTADVTKPVITLLGEASVNLEVGYLYREDGATASDNIDGEITNDIVINSTHVDANTIGTYSVTYNVVDDAGNAADEVIRTVKVTADVTKPVITLLGEASVNLEVGYLYSEAGATATDNIDGEITTDIVINSTHVDANTVGTYSVTYNVVDDAGNAADEVIRTVKVTADVTKPVITLTGSASISFEVGGSYTEAGATANDNIDGEINSRIVIDSTNVDANAVGTYSVTYNVSDIAGNDADEVTREVIVTADVTKPVITLTGQASINFEVGGSYTEAGATANDNIDGPIDSSRIVIDSTSVDANAVGTYSVTYNVSDIAGNDADEVTRAVIVTADVTKPVITLTGSASISFEVGGSYTEAGATANDNIDGEINSRIVTDSTSVDANTVGTYSVTYNVSDIAGNDADEVTRAVIVTADVTKPVITLTGPASISFEVGGSYTEAGATANDNIDGPIDSSQIVIDSTSVDANTVGTYSVTYNVSDNARNAADEVTREVIVVDTTPPTVTIEDIASSVNATPFTVTITFSEAVTGFEKSGIMMSNNVTLTNFSGGVGSTYTVSVTATANGPLSLSVLAEVAKDAAGNLNTASRVIRSNADITAPRVRVLNRLSPIEPDTNVNTLIWSITFSEAVKNVNPSDFILGGSTVIPSVEILSGLRQVYVTASDGDITNFNGDVTLGFADTPGIQDLAGNRLTNTIPTSGPNENTYTLDNMAPRITSIRRALPTAATTNVDLVGWGILFNEAIKDVDKSDFILIGGSTARLKASNPTEKGVYVSASGGDLSDFNGDVTLGFADTRGIQDLAGNRLTNTTPTGTTNHRTFTLDNAGPEVVSIVRVSPTDVRTNADSVRWSILFNEPIKTPDESDFILSTGSRVIPTLVAVSRLEVDVATRGDGRFEVNITASGGDITDFNGDVTLGFADPHNIQDTLGNPLTDTPPTGSGGSTFTFDNRAPEVLSIERASPTDEDTNSDRVSWRVTFSEVVSNADANDFSLNGTTATLAGTVGSSGSAVLVLTASDGDIADLTGQIKLDFADPYTIEDRVGNPLTNTTPTGTTNHRTFTLDNTPPEVVSIVRVSPTAATSNSDSVTWSILFNEPIKNVSASDFILIGGSTVSPSVVIDSSVLVYVTATGGDLADFNGDVTLGFADTHDIQDVVGNRLTDIIPSSRTNDSKVTLDHDAPLILSILRASPTAATTNADSVRWGILFNERIKIKNVDSSDFIIIGGSTAILRVVTANGFGIVVAASGGDLSDFNGDVTLGFADTHDIQDMFGNLLTNTTPTVSNDSTFTLDNRAPEVDLVYTEPGLATTNADSVNWVIVFNERVKNVNVRNFVLSSDSTATLRVDVDTSGIQIVVTASGGDLSRFNGDVTLGFADGHDIQDVAGNPLTNTTPSSGTNRYTFRLDNIAPTVTIEDVPEYINTGQSGTTTGTFTARIIFSESVDGFNTSDYIRVTNANLGAINGSGTTYTVLVIPVTVGTMTFQVAAGVAMDAAGNPNSASAVVMSIVDTIPEIILNGFHYLELEAGDPYIEAGATASDGIDGDISDDIVINGSVDNQKVGPYILRYNVSDDSGNAADTVIRVVRVVDTTAPVITLRGRAVYHIASIFAYIELGATATDNADGDITDRIDIVRSGKLRSLSTNRFFYIITYDVSDSSGNAADRVTRRLNVR